jgi:hypothetical protein
MDENLAVPVPVAVDRLQRFPEFERLVHECRTLMNEIGFNTEVPSQISLQTRDPRGYGSADDPWRGSCGWLEGPGIDDESAEMQFGFINPKLTGSVIERWLTSFPMPLYRARLMLARPGSCYSVHQDPHPRIHIPLVTHPQCLFVFPALSVVNHLPADGHSYWVDTRHFHTFANGSSENRLHIVAATQRGFLLPQLNLAFRKSS